MILVAMAALSGWGHALPASPPGAQADLATVAFIQEEEVMAEEARNRKIQTDREGKLPHVTLT